MDGEGGAQLGGDLPQLDILEQIRHNCIAPLFGIVLGFDSNVLGSLVEIS